MFRKVMDLVSGNSSSPEKEDDNEKVKVGTTPTSRKTTAKEDDPDDKLLKQQQQYNEDEDNVMNDTKTPAQEEEEEEEDASSVVSKMMILPTSKTSKETLVYHPSVSLMMEPELASTRSSNVDVDDDSSTTSGIPGDMPMPRSSSEPKSTSNPKAKSRTAAALGKRKAPAGRIRGRGIIKIRDGTTFRLSDGYRGTPLQTTTRQISSLPFLKRSLVPLLQDDNNNQQQQQFMLATVLTREGFCQTVASSDRCCPLCNFDGVSESTM